LRVHILPYHDAAKGKYALRGAEYALGDIEAPTEDGCRAAVAIFEEAGVAATIGG
jgi:pyruvate-formate lyase-activating enzyme